MVESHKPDVLLLDIQMPEVDGFDVARHLPDDGPMVVFQTAHDEFALKAFDHQAIDYLVKPVSLKRLADALERARKRLGTASPSAYPPGLIAELRTAVSGAQTSGPRRFLVRDGRGHRLLAVEWIRAFVSREGEPYALTAEKDYLGRLHADGTRRQARPSHAPAGRTS
jgi:two-component system LytT family response regulator